MQTTSTHTDQDAASGLLSEGEWVVIDPQGMIVYYVLLKQTQIEFYSLDNKGAPPAVLELSKIQKLQYEKRTILRIETSTHRYFMQKYGAKVDAASARETFVEQVRSACAELGKFIDPPVSGEQPPRDDDMFPQANKWIGGF